MKNKLSYRALGLSAFASAFMMTAADAVVPQGPSITTVQGRQLMLRKRMPDGTLGPIKPYLIKGIDWTPATKAPATGPHPTQPAVTAAYGYFFDCQTCNPQGHVVMNYWMTQEIAKAATTTDIDLMAEMNVNTVRLYTDINTNPADYQKILDKFYEKGIMVIMAVANSKEEIEKNRHLQGVNLAKNHPAILMWTLGNEWNFNNLFGYSSASEATFIINAVAGQVKGSDSNHVVGSILGDRFQSSDRSDIGAIVSGAPMIDVWGLNIYRGASFGTLFDQWKAASTKPFFISEFGTDSFKTDPTGFTRPFGDARAKVTSGQQDQQGQSNYVLNLWKEIAPNLSAMDASKTCTGGVIFEFNDELWKVGNFNVGLGDLVNYNTTRDYNAYNQDGFYIPGGHPDSVANEEHFGIVDANRTKKQAFNVLKDYYATLDQSPSTPPITVSFSRYISTVFGGTVTLSAITSDIAQTAGVQFKLDETVLGPEDTTSPYEITFDTKRFQNGIHTMIATARDLSNRLSSATLQIEIRNVDSDAQAVFVATNTTVQGNWKGNYGSGGYSIARDSTRTPRDTNIAFRQENAILYQDPSTDPRALQKVFGGERVAAAYSNDSGFELDVIPLRDGITQPVSVYLIDWDQKNREEVVTVRDTLNRKVLDRRIIRDFSNGVYLTWNIYGAVTFQFEKVSGPSAVASAIFFDQCRGLECRKIDGRQIATPNLTVPSTLTATDVLRPTSEPNATYRWEINSTAIVSETLELGSLHLTPGRYPFRVQTVTQDGRLSDAGEFSFDYVSAPSAQITVPTAPSVVSVQGKQLILQKRLSNGSLAPAAPFIMKGVDWSPSTRAPVSGPDPRRPGQTTPYGFFFDFAGRMYGSEVLAYWEVSEIRDRSATDFQKIAAMNANTIRVYHELGHTREEFLKVLDDAYQNGIYVIVSVAGSKKDIDDGRPAQVVQWAKDHPAVLMWVIGNEWNLNNLYSSDINAVQARNLVRQVAQQIKQVDTAHPITSVLGDRFQSTNGSDIPSIVAAIPEVDIWGLNIYRGSSFGQLFTQWQNTTSKPFYFGEFGTDSFITDANGFTRPFNDGRAQVTSGSEDQNRQASWDIGLWREIIPQLSARDAQKGCVGGLVFSFNDALWKVGNFHVGLGNLVPSGDTSYTRYNPDGFFSDGNRHPDPVDNQEYFGIVTADRGEKEVYRQLRALYATLNPPGEPVTVSFSRSISNVVASTATFTAITSGATRTAGIQFFIDDQPLGTEDTEAPYSVSFDTTRYPNGTHTMKAVARDVDNQLSSATLLIEIRNLLSSSVSFTGVNTTTQGSWKGVLGAGGYTIVGDAERIPRGVEMATSGQTTLSWATSTSDTRALMKASGNDRVAAAFSSADSFEVRLRLTDGTTQPVSIYFLDWDRQGRDQLVTVRDNLTGAVIDSRHVQNFQEGVYLTWKVYGDVTFRFEKVAGTSAVLSGIFFNECRGLICRDIGGRTIATPQMVVAEVLSLKDVLRPSNLGGDIRSFRWEIRAAGTPAGSTAKASIAAMPDSVIVIEANELNLSQLNLPPGRYVLTVQSIGPDGLLSEPVEFTFGFSAISLANAGVYPNPWRADRDAGLTDIFFDNLTPDSEVKIFTLSGRWVQTLKANGLPTARWNLRNADGDSVASGLYLYIITNSQDERKRGKLAIIR